MAADGPLERHDLVWLGADWAGALRAPLAHEDRTALAGWFAAGRPAVVRRAGPDDPAGGVPLGVPLPPAWRRRLALSVDPAAVTRRGSPPALLAALAAAPEAWQARLAALAAALAEAGAPAAVYGSLAWQHLTGERYLGPGSDVDLLVRPAHAAALAAALAILTAGGAEAPRLDGEVLLPEGRAVAWRELSGRPARLLVKSAAGVALAGRAAALGALAGRAP